MDDLQDALDVLSAECFPSSVRASAFAALAATGRVGSIVAQLVNGSLSHHVPTLLAVTSAFMAAASVGGVLTPRHAACAPPDASTGQCSHQHEI